MRHWAGCAGLDAAVCDTIDILFAHIVCSKEYSFGRETP